MNKDEIKHCDNKNSESFCCKTAYDDVCSEWTHSDDYIHGDTYSCGNCHDWRWRE